MLCRNTATAEITRIQHARGAAVAEQPPTPDAIALHSCDTGSQGPRRTCLGQRCYVTSVPLKSQARKKKCGDTRLTRFHTLAFPWMRVRTNLLLRVNHHLPNSSFMLMCRISYSEPHTKLFPPLLFPGRLQTIP